MKKEKPSWSEINCCDGCDFHIIEHRCTNGSYRGRLMNKPKTKCKNRKVPSNEETEVAIESKVPFKETLEMHLED